MLLDDIEKQVIGIDEVGRGALCGPVVSCSVLLSPKIIENDLVYEINDSKKIPEKKRHILAEFIKQNSTYFIGFATNKEIDKVNILQATNLSMKRSYEKFKLRNCLVKIDGTQTFELTKKTIFIKGGDSKSLSIAAASIIAKNWRDNLMLNYSKIYPQYSWDKNNAYGTKKHKEAIIKYGITDFHRLSFLKKFKLLIEAERC